MRILLTPLLLDYDSTVFPCRIPAFRLCQIFRMTFNMLTGYINLFVSSLVVIALVLKRLNRRFRMVSSCTLQILFIRFWLGPWVLVDLNLPEFIHASYGCWACRVNTVKCVIKLYLLAVYNNCNGNYGLESAWLVHFCCVRFSRKSTWHWWCLSLCVTDQS